MTRRSLLPLLFATTLCACSASEGAGAELSAGTATWNFDNVSLDAIPYGWRIEATNPGEESALWSATAEPDGNRILRLVDPRGATGQTYNLCWTDELDFGDGRIEVEVRAGTGVEDQGGGPAWRIRDADNYYLARWNPLENNFRVYSVRDGKRRQLDSAETRTDARAWHTLAIEQSGTRIRCWLDGELMLEVTDDTHMESGGVGLWTKADAATDFDDLSASVGAG